MTLKEIAALAGVSVSTVSRVINNQNTKCASQEVQNKIWAAVRSLGYTPNPHAQSLKRNNLEKSSRSFHSSIAFACSELFLLGSHHDWEMLSLFEKEILSSHYSVSAPRADLPAAEEKVRDLGLVLVGTEPERRIAQYIEKYKNVVCISEHRTAQPCDLVLLDMSKSLLRAWEYLRELGHRRIFFAGAEKGDFFRTYTDVIPADAQAQFIPCGLSMSDGMLLAGELCDCLMVPSALVCENNSIACGAIQALREHRLAVPADVSVVSLGGGLDLSRAALPVSVTVFSYNKAEISRLAVDLLIDRIHRRHLLAVTYEPGCEMDDNGSCAAAREVI